MRKKLFAMYALAGALVASPVFTSCVDDTVSDSVEALRTANTQYKNAQTAQIQANTAIAQANAVLLQEAQRIANELAAAKLAHEKAMNAYEEALKEAENAQYIEEARIALENALREEAIAKAKAEAALEAAKLKAQEELINAQKTHMAAQKDMENYIAGLDAAKKNEANKLNGNIDAIMNGGHYYLFDGTNWNNNRYYYSTYTADVYNSIVALNEGLINQNVNLHNLKNDLVDIEEWMAEEKLKQEETIAKQEALIAKYTELQKLSSREEAEKAYEDAKDKKEAVEAEKNEINYAKLSATQALTAHKNVMASNPIQKMVATIENYNNWGYTHEYMDYLTTKEQEECNDTITLLNGKTVIYSKQHADVYEHTEENAEKLAEKIAGIEEDIEEKKEEIAELETQMAKVNATELQREAAVAKANADKVLKEYETVLASEAYKKKVAELEKAVADAQAAFNANPTDFTEYQAENEDGTPKVDAEGNPVMIKSTKQLLEEAEDALADVVEDNNYNYGTEDEPKYLSDLYASLYQSQVVTSVEGPQPYDLENYEYWYWDTYYGNGLVELAEKLAYGVEVYRLWDEGYLKNYNEVLESLNEELEEYKELQAMLAATSDEMKEYVALCEKRAELEDAESELTNQASACDSNISYYQTIIDTLNPYVIGNTPKLPDFEEMIKTAEKAIKAAEKAIADLEYTQGQGQNANKLNKEAAIAKKEAEIKAIEEELKIRQAEYDAEMAELKALVGAEEEVPAE